MLNIGENRFGRLSGEIACSLRGCLPFLRTLIVSNTPLLWSDVQALGLVAPALEELHVARCGIVHIVEASASGTCVADAQVEDIMSGCFSRLKVRKARNR